MIYYRVLPQADNKQVYTKTTKGLKPKRVLVANELYTFKELLRYNISVRYVVVERHKPQETYMCFGVRKACPAQVVISSPQNAQGTPPETDENLIVLTVNKE